MDNKQKYEKAFIDSFSIDGSVSVEDLKYEKIPEWDSIGHMALMASLEEAFNIMMETDDIIAFSSFKKGIELLAKYGVEI